MLLAAAIVVPAVLASACSRPRDSAAPSDRLRLLLSPASFGDSIAVQQRVRVERDGQDGEFDAVLEVSPRIITLVGLGYGIRLFTLRYDGDTFDEQRHPMLPREFEGRDVLSDIQLALWPAAAIRAALPPQWSLSEEALTRTLRREDADIVVIRYSALPRGRSDLVLEHRTFRYQLTVRAAPEAP